MHGLKAGSQGGSGHRWRFRRVGGVDQVVFQGGADFEHLPTLDLKLWMALCMPARGIALDPRTADLLDTDKDGFIRPPELLAAVKWCTEVFEDASCLIEPSDRVELALIRDPRLLAGARRILKNLRKTDAESVTLADVASQEKIFADTRFNGDGVVPASSADTPERISAVEDIVRVCGGVPDRSGKTGVDTTTLEGFIRDATLCVAWYRRGREEPSVYPLPPDQTVAALEAVRAVRAKVDDFFTRCRLAAFDERAGGALNGDAGLYQPFGRQTLSATASEMADMPLARVTAGAALPLVAAVNPAWAAPLERLRAHAIQPLLETDAAELTPACWTTLQTRLSAYEAWQSARPATPVMSLGEERLVALLEPAVTDAIRALIAKDSALKEENAQIEKIEMMIRFRRDLYEVLTNYVNFADFYGQTYAIFQAGSLFLDARACHLCIEVADAARHAALAGLSNAYLAYCDIRRAGVQRSIVAVITDGDSHNINAGRNGVFYDREGRDWNATITRVVSNPISVREAFWLPYRKLVRLIEEQIEKRAQAAEAASMNRMTETATVVATADQARPPAGVPTVPAKIELGTIALIGTAIGGISALVGGFLQVLFGLGFWLPVGLLGIVLLISGPSMLLAAIKLKQRNLGPILDANGWAINTRARMNPAFGAALTELARLPAGSERSFKDPYARCRRPWRKRVLLAILAVVAGFWWWQWQETAGGAEPATTEPVAEATEPAAPAP